MEQSLRNRLTFGPIMLAALLGLLALDHWAELATRTWAVPGKQADYGVGGLGILLLLIIVLPPAVLEVTALFTAEHVRPYRTIAALGAGSLVAHAFLTQFLWFQDLSASIFAFIIVGVMLAAALRRAKSRQTQEAIVRMAGTVLAALYLGGLGWFLMALRVKHAKGSHDFNGSTMVVVMILLVVKFTDIGAYFGGRALGRHKLIPWLSPGKTWEGLLIGMLTAGAIGALCAIWIHLPTYTLPWWKGFIFGFILGGIGQLGDLLESLMKRDADVKDSGRLIPGFGGILDVIDSPLLAAPFAYLLFSLF
jgi:phosphatidate cytidylyltransferase